MGTAAHSVLEAAYRGEFQQDEDPKRAALALWDELIHAAIEGVDGVPDPARWRDYQMKRLRAATRAGAVSRREPAARSAKKSQSGTRIEDWLASGDGKVRGRPDRIEVTAGKATIIDLKTSTLDPGEVPLAYRQQLQLYAWLWHETASDWPVAAEIELLDGSRRPIDVVPEECESLAVEAVDALESFNQLVESQADFLELASPDEEQCRYCRYCGGCPAFLNRADESWRSFRATIGGRLLGDSAHTEADARCLTIAVEWGTAGSDALEVKIRGRIGGPQLESGCTVVVDNVIPEVAAHDYWADWDSLVWVWDSPGAALA